MSYDSRPDTWAHIHEVRKRITDVVQDLLARAEEHDQTKLSAPELGIFDMYSDRLREVEYDSPQYRTMLKGMEVGLDHHYAHNDHHPEHFTGCVVSGTRLDQQASGRHQGTIDLPPGAGIHGMNLVQLLELLCDWKAATIRMKDGGNLRTSIEVNSERFGYGDEIKNLLLHTAAYFDWL